MAGFTSIIEILVIFVKESGLTHQWKLVIQMRALITSSGILRFGYSADDSLAGNEIKFRWRGLIVVADKGFWLLAFGTATNVMKIASLYSEREGCTMLDN